MKKIILNAARTNLKNSILITLLCFLGLLKFENVLNAQSAIDKTYAFNDNTGKNIDLQNKVDYSTCKSVKGCNKYIAASSFKNFHMGNDLYQIKIFEFDSLGAIIEKKVIVSSAVLHYVVTDIKIAGTGYVLVGYIDPLSNLQPMHPFIILLDKDLVVSNQAIIDERGMFSRVSVTPINDFVCVGYKGDSTDAKCNKNGLIVKINNSLTTISSYVIPSSYISQSFTNINDILNLSSSESVIAGTNMVINNGCIEIRVLIMRLNHNTGAITWYNNQIGIAFTSPKIDINNNNIYVIVNGENPITSAILKYDLTGGGYKGGAFFETSPFYNCENSVQLIHIPYFQNIKCLGNDTVMVTGKFVIGSELVFDTKFYMPDFPGPMFWNAFNSHVNYTDFQSVNNDVTGYFGINGIDNCINARLIQPIYTSSNTVFFDNPRVPVTVTYTNVRNLILGRFFKTWTFTNGFSSSYGFNNITLTNAGVVNALPSTLTLMLNNFTTLSPLYLENLPIFESLINCPVRGDCCR